MRATRHLQRYSALPPSQLLGVAFRESLRALADPHLRGDSVAALGEATGEAALVSLRDRMQKDPVGNRVLQERPLLNPDHVDIGFLNELPARTLGGAYARYLSMHGFEFGKRPPVRLILDPELAFVMQRYRDTHDLLHTVYGVPVSVSGEVALKWFEMVQTGLPMTALAALFGSLQAETSLSPFSGIDGADGQGNDQEPFSLITYINWCCRAANQSDLFLNVYFEKHWEQDLVQFRNEIGCPKLAPGLPSLDASFDKGHVAGMRRHYEQALHSLAQKTGQDERRLPFLTYLNALAELDNNDE